MEPIKRFGGVARAEDRNPAGSALVPPIQHQGTDPLFTWEQAVRVLRKNRKFVLLLAGVLTCGAVAGALLMRDVYQPTARLEIDPVSSGIKTLHEIEDFDSN